MPRRPVALLFFFLLLLRSACAADRNVGPIVSHIRRAAVESSVIAAVGYSKRLHALEIEFRNGFIYRYEHVAADVYRELLSAESKARYYDQNVRGKYHSVRVKPASDR